ncbi:hypothetical protein [Corynebacterium sp. A21]|uniref:hypothetical protein n=1 Tax=Corynebacterium sp. A21 TaxID=3457318 RepID=UPI003FD526A6
MPKGLIAALNPTRLSSYEEEWKRLSASPTSTVSPSAVAALYVWQVSLHSAWFETLSYTEAIIRNAIDLSLRDWNSTQWNKKDQRHHSDDWLDDPAQPLTGLVKFAASQARDRATTAAKRRPGDHPRHGEEVTFDDRVSQLDFGNIGHLLPMTPPEKRGSIGTGFNKRENLWIHGIRAAFPELSPELMQRWRGQYPDNLPDAVVDAYAVGHALDRLRRLRNRVSHHEQTFMVQHSSRLADVDLLVRSISPSAADDLQQLDRVRRTLAMRPHP